MIRTILRNVQNSLMLSSALLALVALQRLRSFDTGVLHPNHQHHPSYGPEGQGQHHQEVTQQSIHSHVGAHARPPASDPLFENGILDGPLLRLGGRERLRLGLDFRSGLYRFVLPWVERGDSSNSGSTNTNTNNKDSFDPAFFPAGQPLAGAYVNTNPKGALSSPSRHPEWHVMPETSSVAFVVDLNEYLQELSRGNVARAATTTTTTTMTAKDNTRMMSMHCSRLLDAAAVLRLSVLARRSLLRRTQHRQGNAKTPRDTLYALLPTTLASAPVSPPKGGVNFDALEKACNVTAALARLGFEVVRAVDKHSCGSTSGDTENRVPSLSFSSSPTPSFSSSLSSILSVSSQSPDWQHHAMSIEDTDIVLKIPLTSIVVAPQLLEPELNKETVKGPSPNTQRRKSRRRLSVKRNNNNSNQNHENDLDGPTMQEQTGAVTMLVPRKQCHGHINTCVNTTLSVSSLQPCKVSRSISVISFHTRACPLPSNTFNVESNENVAGASADTFATTTATSHHDNNEHHHDHGHNNNNNNNKNDDDDDDQFVRQYGQTCALWRSRWRHLYWTVQDQQQQK